ncbi:MAG: cohesin domain-containing protein, partial [bacterium]|nr:cohesin domain-containing protein [bacterium]
MNSFFKKIVCCISVLLCVYGHTTFAAEVILITDKPSVVIGEKFLVNIVVNSKELLNAIEGKLEYPSDVLTVQDIRIGSSVINLWIEGPTVSKEGTIVCSGVTPGGIRGTGSMLFSIVFEARKTGNAQLDLKDLILLLNDGKGTPAPTDINVVVVTIIPGESTGANYILLDSEIPEDFSPMIAKNPTIFEGKNFISFSTQDKVSGIDYYKIREGKFGWYKTVQSPYVLRNQRLDSKIFVKAVDVAGNERIVVLNPQVPMPWWKKYLLAILCGIAVLL